MGAENQVKLKGYLVGVFGSNPDQKLTFENSIAKRNEAEGITVFLRSEGGIKYSFLDDGSFPEKIQGYARIASIADYAYYIFPTDGKLSAADGELAVLLDSLGLKGSIEVIDAQASAYADIVKNTFKGVSISNFPIEERNSKSSVLSLSHIHDEDTRPKKSTLIYVDRAFNVKGVGLVVLGFVLSGRVSIHDRLRMIPGTSRKVRGGQGNPGQRRGPGFSGERNKNRALSQGRGVKDFEKVSWLDDGTLGAIEKDHIQFHSIKVLQAGHTEQGRARPVEWRSHRGKDIFIFRNSRKREEGRRVSKRNPGVGGHADFSLGSECKAAQGDGWRQSVV